MSREEGGEVGSDSDASNSRSSSTVRDAEGLVEVQMTDVSTDSSRTSKAHLGIHVGTVHVNLSSSVVDGVADFDNRLFKDTKGGRVGNHKASELVPVLSNLGLEVVHVAITLIVVVDDNNLHAGHSSRGGVGAVGRLGNEADVPVSLPLGLKVSLDAEEAGEFSSGTGVRLSGNGGETSDFAKVPIQILDHLVVALDLVVGREGVNVGGLIPGYGDHLSRCVEFHGARTKGDHAVVEGKVLVLESLEVPEHLGLRVVLVEDRVGHDGLTTAVSTPDGGKGLVSAEVRGSDSEAGGEEVGNVLAGDSLSHADSNSVVVNDTNVGAGCGGGVRNS
mmetsp:Transcript_800/g.1428  ORF Transcript_800/g.1428 Transcript_800/m.1428 type:complete len:333 (+) Transcript_800:829-1827(+)